MAENKSSLNYVLQSVLSIGNKESNASYPAYIFSQHFNIVTSFIIDKCIEAYPKYQDVLRPFIASKNILTKDGYVILPEDYRNMLGAPSISAKNDKSGECSDAPVTESSFKSNQLKSGCSTRPIEMLSHDEWDYRTTSTYKSPTVWNPIGSFFGSDRFKVCPYDIGVVDIRYIKKEKIVFYGYVMQPDDTYIFDPATSVESEWTDAASEFLIKGVYALYSAYTRDETGLQYSQILNQAGLF